MAVTASDPDTTIFDLNNAHYLARAAQLAYLDPSQGLRERVEEELGLTQLQFFQLETGRQSTEAFAAVDDEKVVVAFRGTEPDRLADWLTDFRFTPQKRRGGEVHGGFDRALDEILPEMFAYVRDQVAKPLDLSKVVEAKDKTKQIGRGTHGRTLWLTGHSLGGAIANLMGGRLALEEDYPLEDVYTFGQPRACDRDYTLHYNAILGKRHHRFVNNNDLVTRVPTRSLGFSHVGSLQYFDVDGQLHDEIGWWSRFLDRVSGRFEDFIEIFRRGDLVTDGFEDHGLQNGYVPRIAKALDPS